MSGRCILTKAEKAWIVLAGGVLVTDLFLIYKNEETMSAAFGRWLLIPKRKWLCVALTVIMILHLYEEFPLPGQKSIKKIMKGIKVKYA
jgi:hypothetical protein